MLDVKHELNILGKNEKSIETLFINKKCNIIILGPLDYDKMKEQYRYNDMLILPTLMDNFPNTIFESFSCITAVVAYYVGGVKDLVTLKTGCLSKYKSTESLLTGVLYVKENLSYLFSNINKMKSKYSYKIILKEYNNIYKSL
jgi:glycosyltransferase involved in cell wall biosynthesis